MADLKRGNGPLNPFLLLSKELFETEIRTLCLYKPGQNTFYCMARSISLISFFCITKLFRKCLLQTKSLEFCAFNYKLQTSSVESSIINFILKFKKLSRWLIRWLFINSDHCRTRNMHLNFCNRVDKKKAKYLSSMNKYLNFGFTR